jgi:hypothetical protein
MCDCGKPIIMALSTSTGSPMPMLATPVPNGEYVIEPGHDGLPRARHLKPQYRFGLTTLYASHFADCPNATKHRRRPKRSQP